MPADERRLARRRDASQTPPGVPSVQGNAWEHRAMSTDRNGSGSTDHTRINCDDPQQLRFWCNELRCTEGQLRDAVRRVGATVVRVRAYLGQ